MPTAIDSSHTPVRGLSGPAGYGEISLELGAEGWQAVDISAAFPDGLTFFGTHYDTPTMWVGINGAVAFEEPPQRFVPDMVLNLRQPVIAVWPGDLSMTVHEDARLMPAVYVDIDETAGVVSVTWDDVPPQWEAWRNWLFAGDGNTFQLQLYDRGEGDFTAVMRYGSLTFGYTIPGLGAGNGIDFAIPVPGDSEPLQVTPFNIFPAPESAYRLTWHVFNVEDGIASLRGDLGLSRGGISGQITGTEADESLLAYGGKDTFLGLGGDDTILGGGGHDQIDAGDGNDQIASGYGRDTVLGGGGDDSINAGLGDDSVDGGAGNDTLDGWAGQDTLVGGDGDDRIYGTMLANLIEGGAGNDHIDPAGGGDTVLAGPGDDRISLHLGRSDLQIDGGDGSDTLYLSAGFRTHSSGAFIDLQTPEGTSLADSGVFLTGVENISGTKLQDRLYGDDNANILLGGNHYDVIYGRSGNDTIGGGRSGDLLVGGLGADRLVTDETRHHFTGSYVRDGDYLIWVLDGLPGGNRLVYFDAAESPDGAGNRDVVTAFQGVANRPLGFHSFTYDRIELGRIDADITQGFRQDFVFVGTDEFSETAGELRYELIDSPVDGVSEPGALVQADRDGDGRADFEIEIEQLYGILTEDNFLL